MKFNKKCFDDLIKFIEENMEFEKTTAPALISLEIKGVYLETFVEKYQDYNADEIKYNFYIMRQIGYITEDHSARGGNSPLIKGITKDGYKYLLKLEYKLSLD